VSQAGDSQQVAIKMQGLHNDSKALSKTFKLPSESFESLSKVLLMFFKDFLKALKVP
jgi:hypothetical protein